MVGRLVGGVLQLDDDERQAVDEEDDVRTPVRPALDDGELVDGQPVVGVGISKSTSRTVSPTMRPVRSRHSTSMPSTSRRWKRAVRSIERGADSRRDAPDGVLDGAARALLGLGGRWHRAGGGARRLGRRRRARRRARRALSRGRSDLDQPTSASQSSAASSTVDSATLDRHRPASQTSAEHEGREARPRSACGSSASRRAARVRDSLQLAIKLVRQTRRQMIERTHYFISR